MNQNNSRTVLLDGSYINHYTDHDTYCNSLGILHREDGPAVVWRDGFQEWYCNGERHRIDGPAVVYHDVLIWFYQSKRHRLDGPAVVYVNGSKDYYIHGDFYSEIEYWKLIRLKAFW